MKDIIELNINNRKIECETYKIPLTEEFCITYNIIYSDCQKIKGQRYVKSFDYNYLENWFKDNLNLIENLPELDVNKHSEILYDLVKEIWLSPYNNAYFDFKYIRSNYDDNDIDKFLRNDIVQNYISKGLISIIGEFETLDFTIEAYGDLGDEFIAK